MSKSTEEEFLDAVLANREQQVRDLLVKMYVAGQRQLIDKCVDYVCDAEQEFKLYSIIPYPPGVENSKDSNTAKLGSEGMRTLLKMMALNEAAFQEDMQDRQEYEFEIELRATVKVEAPNHDRAREALKQAHLDFATANKEIGTHVINYQDKRIDIWDKPRRNSDALEVAQATVCKFAFNEIKFFTTQELRDAIPTEDERTIRQAVEIMEGWGFLERTIPPAMPGFLVHPPETNQP